METNEVQQLLEAHESLGRLMTFIENFFNLTQFDLITDDDGKVVGLSMFTENVGVANELIRTKGVIDSIISSRL